MPPEYDLDAERARYDFPDAVRGGVRLNRATATPERSDDPEGTVPEFAAIRRAHTSTIVASTLAPDSPVIELDRPSTGIYVASRRGTYLDLYQGVAQRLFDDARIAPRLEPLIAAGLLQRREINTDDFLGFAPDGVRTPQDLAALITAEAQRAFPRPDGYRVFFSNSGTESIEAAIKASTRSAYQRFIARFGEATWEAVCAALDIERDPAFQGSAPVWRDYPLFCIALHGAFHGRTLGSLALTESRPGQRIGFPLWRWVVHVSPRDPADLEARIDRRPIADLLAEHGALARTIAEGRVPVDLLAAAFFEPLQGEGGYRTPNSDVLAGLRALCNATGALLVADEVQTFARGGATFYSETSSVHPDVLCLGKAAILGVTIMPGLVADGLQPGWHSNTFGSGKLFDVNYSYAVIDTFLHERDAMFGGLSFAENEEVKGRYLRDGLEALIERFPRTVSDIDGRGSIWGFTVTDRAPFIEAAWREGAKLLGAGGAERPGRVRLILPADVLAKEVDDVLEVLARTCEAVDQAR